MTAIQSASKRILYGNSDLQHHRNPHGWTLVDGVDMSIAEAELRTGFVEAEDGEAVEGGNSG
jgi:hypothetical protein